MPNFRAHTVINLLSAAGMSYAAVTRYGIDPQRVAISAAAFTVATFFLSPDLDLKHSSPTRNWGFFRWFWRPYQLFFKHRGLSHSLIFSSLTRLGYLLGVATLGLIGLQVWIDPSPAAIAEQASILPGPASAVLSAHGVTLATASVGIALSDTCHIVADRFFSALRALTKIW